MRVRRTVHNAVLALFAGDSLLELVDAAAVAKDDAGCVRVSVSLFSREVAALYVQQFPQQLLNDLKSQVNTHYKYEGITAKIKLKGPSNFLTEYINLVIMYSTDGG